MGVVVEASAFSSRQVEHHLWLTPVLSYPTLLASQRKNEGGNMFSAKLIAIVRAFAIIPGCLLGLLLGASIALAADGSGPLTGTVPKAICGPGDHTESGLQGETTLQERFGGDSERAYNCNLELVSEYRGEGAFSQDGPAYSGDCAYYGTDNVTSLQQHLGVTVIDASDPLHPHPSAYLNDTAAARAPHETVQTNDRSH